MPDQPTPLWGLWSDEKGWLFGLVYPNQECAEYAAVKFDSAKGYVPVQLVPADALEASQARVAELLESLQELSTTAEQAMREANRDGAGYLIEDELEAARAAIATATGDQPPC